MNRLPPCLTHSIAYYWAEGKGAIRQRDDAPLEEEAIMAQYTSNDGKLLLDILYRIN